MYASSWSVSLTETEVASSVVVVSVLATGHKGRGFKTGRGDGP
jgi:hypothetical protein